MSLIQTVKFVAMKLTLNYSQLYLYFSPRVIRNEEHYVYSLIGLIASIGGYLSMYRLAIWLLDLCNFTKLKKGCDSNTNIEGESNFKVQKAISTPPVDEQ